MVNVNKVIQILKRSNEVFGGKTYSKQKLKNLLEGPRVDSNWWKSELEERLIEIKQAEEWR